MKFRFPQGPSNGSEHPPVPSNSSGHPQVPVNGSGHKWRHRRQSVDTPATTPASELPELLAVSCTTLCRELSPGAERLFSAINGHNAYVICIDPRTIAALSGVSEQKLPHCLNELRRAGMISTWMGNLVFFD